MSCFNTVVEDDPEVLDTYHQILISSEDPVLQLSQQFSENSISESGEKKPYRLVAACSGIEAVERV